MVAGRSWSCPRVKRSCVDHNQSPKLLIYFDRKCDVYPKAGFKFSSFQRGTRFSLPIWEFEEVPRSFSMLQVLSRQRSSFSIRIILCVDRTRSLVDWGSWAEGLAGADNLDCLSRAHFRLSKRLKPALAFLFSVRLESPRRRHTPLARPSTKPILPMKEINEERLIEFDSSHNAWCRPTNGSSNLDVDGMTSRSESIS